MDTALAAALAAAPRRYGVPPLPADIQGARAEGTDLALAFALERARTGDPPGVRELFLDSLAALVGQSLDPDAGDPAFQALVVHAGEPQVQEYVGLQATAAQDARAVRRIVDAVAHPARLAQLGPAQASRLSTLYQLARDGQWAALRDRNAGDLAQLPDHPSLQRLVRAESLRASAPVARYLGLLEAQGPAAGSDAATEQGRHSANAGRAAEAATVSALQEIADGLRTRDHAALRVARGLRTPRGFPGDAVGKAEWDVALLEHRGTAADILLLGEVKVSPAAAPADFSRLHRGLLRLAQAQERSDYEFPSGDGAVQISGESLRALAPIDGWPPKHVVYFSTAPAGPVPPLSAAAKAMLLGDPASVAFAQSGDRRQLEPAWDALRAEPRMRATLHQYDTARRVCESMLHPLDLLTTFRAIA